MNSSRLFNVRRDRLRASEAIADEIGVSPGRSPGFPKISNSARLLPGPPARWPAGGGCRAARSM